MKLPVFCSVRVKIALELSENKRVGVRTLRGNGFRVQERTRLKNRRSTDEIRVSNSPYADRVLKVPVNKVQASFRREYFPFVDSVRLKDARCFQTGVFNLRQEALRKVS